MFAVFQGFRSKLKDMTIKPHREVIDRSFKLWSHSLNQKKIKTNAEPVHGKYEDAIKKEKITVVKLIICTLTKILIHKFNFLMEQDQASWNSR